MKRTPLAPSGAASASRPPLQDHVGLLEAALQLHLGGWHRARRQAVAQAVLALIVACSVNLTKVARACVGPAQLGSHYRRLQRLLA